MNIEDFPARAEHRGIPIFNGIVNGLCLLLLILIMAAVTYGFLLRAPWERGYYAATGFVLVGAVVTLVALAQQEIAARDKATWYAMAEWQLRATYRKLQAARGVDVTAPGSGSAQDDDYYSHLVEALIEDMQRVSEEAAKS
jgi:hypothetical protein